MSRRDAAAWLARLQSRRDPDVERKFQRWYEADPANRAAFERVRSSYEKAGLLRHSQAARSASLDQPVARPPRQSFAIAASLAVCLLAVAALFLSGGRFAGTTEALMLTTDIGEIKRVALADGSAVTLDTNSSIEVKTGRSERRALIRRGRARFEIAAGRRPFVIDAALATVTADKGIVDVETRNRQTAVDVHAGSMAVRATTQSKAAALELGAGEGATVAASAAVETHRLPPGPDWTRGMLQFEDARLADVIARANLYSKNQIVIAPQLAELRVTGAFRAGDNARLAKALAAAFGLRLRRAQAGNLLLSPKL